MVNTSLHGQSLFSIVLNDDVWVVANFKETQFDKMRIGQKVIVHADAFPGHDFEGNTGFLFSGYRCPFCAPSSG